MQQVQDRPYVYRFFPRARGATAFFRLLATSLLRALYLDYNFAISFYEPILTGWYTFGRLWTRAVWHEMHRRIEGGGGDLSCWTAFTKYSVARCPYTCTAVARRRYRTHISTCPTDLYMIDLNTGLQVSCYHSQFIFPSDHYCMYLFRPNLASS